MPDAYLSAILSNDPARVADFLDRKPSRLEQRWEDSYRPLHWAALYGCEDTVKLLLERGANVHAQVEVPPDPGSGDSNVWFDHQMRFARDGWTARDMAIHADFPSIAHRLQEAGAPCRVSGPGLDTAWWHGVAAGYRKS